MTREELERALLPVLGDYRVGNEEHGPTIDAVIRLVVEACCAKAVESVRSGKTWRHLTNTRKQKEPTK